MEAGAELAESKGLDFFFADLDGLDVLNGDGSSVWDARAETRCGRAVPGGQAGLVGEFADFGFGEIGFNQGCLTLCSFAARWPGR